MRKRIPLQERLLIKASKDSSGCWLWGGVTNNKGYGNIWKPELGKKILAHRASFELFVGPIPDGLLVLHRCDVPACINPKHLYLGTQKDNMCDASKKGRVAKPYTHYAPRLKLSSANVRYMRRSKLSPKLLADKYGVSLDHVYGILRGIHRISNPDDMGRR